MRTALLSSVDFKLMLALKVITGGRLNAYKALEQLFTGTDATSFLVYRKTEPFSSIAGMEPAFTLTQSGQQSLSDDTVGPNTTYYYALAVTDAAGNMSSPIFSNSAQTGLFARKGVSVSASVPQTASNFGSALERLRDMMFGLFGR